jgi:hypothetical protein
MKTIFLSELLLTVFSVTAQENNFVGTEKILSDKSTNLSVGIIKPPSFFQSQKGDTTFYSFLPNAVQTFTLHNGDKVEYGNGRMPVVKPNMANLQVNIPNLSNGKNKESNPVQGQMPNAAPLQRKKLTGKNIIPNRR